MNVRKGTLALTVVLALALAWPQAGFAGERQWAAAGKVLTGVLVASLLAPLLVQPAPAAVYTPPPVYVAPPPAYCAPPPVVYYTPPVYVAPRPVYYVAPPVWRGTVIYYRSGYGGRDCRGGSDWRSRGGSHGPNRSGGNSRHR